MDGSNKMDRYDATIVIGAMLRWCKCMKSERRVKEARLEIHNLAHAIALRHQKYRQSDDDYGKSESRLMSGNGEEGECRRENHLEHIADHW